MFSKMTSAQGLNRMDTNHCLVKQILNSNDWNGGIYQDREIILHTDMLKWMNTKLVEDKDPCLLHGQRR